MAKSITDNRVAQDIQPTYNRSVRIEPSRQRLSSNGGALLLRELDEALAFFPSFSDKLMDPRDPGMIHYSLQELLRQRVFQIALGERAQDAADRLRDDPVLRAAVHAGGGPRAFDKALSSQPTQSRLLDIVAHPENRRCFTREAVPDLLLQTRRRFHCKPRRTLTLDLDSTNHPVYGRQPGGRYNGHYEERCYHPLLAFVAETGDLAHAWLRNGNVTSESGAWAFVQPVLRVLEQTHEGRIDFRGDAAFAHPKLMHQLETHEHRYVFRLKKNPVLDRLAAPFLTRPVGRPPDHIRTWMHELTYAAKSWPNERRVLLVVIDDPAERFLGDPQLRYFFLVTNYKRREKNGETLLEHYRQRGTCETWIGQLKREISPLLNADTFHENQVNLVLFALAYQFGVLLAKLQAQTAGATVRMQLATVRTHLLKVAARVILHARRVIVQIAEEAFEPWQAIFAALKNAAADVSARGSP